MLKSEISVTEEWLLMDLIFFGFSKPRRIFPISPGNALQRQCKYKEMSFVHQRLALCFEDASIIATSLGCQSLPKTIVANAHSSLCNLHWDLEDMRLNYCHSVSRLIKVHQVNLFFIEGLRVTCMSLKQRFYVALLNHGPM